MMERYLVDNCPLCEIFTKKNIKTKIYWPLDIEDVPKSEFVILECTNCKVPMVVLGEHVTSVSKECWGRILYRCRKLFGGGISLRTYQRTIKDHIHYHVSHISKNI